MKRTALGAVVLTAIVGVGALASVAAAQAVPASPAGLWDAAVVVDGLEIPFRFEIGGSGTALTASFFNGDDRLESTGGRAENGSVVLDFDHMATKVEAVMLNGRLVGVYNRGPRGVYPFYAQRFTPSTKAPTDVPRIDGVWQIGDVNSNKGEQAWRLIVRQSGAEVTAAILRIDGDTGALAGTFKDGKFVVSHFDGARPMVLELTPAKDGSLEINRNRVEKMGAIKATEAEARNLPRPTDPSRHSSVKDPTARFTWSFPGMDGRPITGDDPRFQGKVVIVSIGGSWCPNCHDEAPFLVELYKAYRERGLEIVGFSFEENNQLPALKRLKAFNARYGVDWPIVIPGEPADLADKIPQIVNLNSFPTTLFIGRDGRVKAVHAGFAGKASGHFYEEGVEEIRATVERLLAETATTKSK